MAFSVEGVPTDQFATSGSSMTIEELEPTFPGGKLRRLVLVGGGLPLRRQAKWDGETRLATTWYTGNGLAASQQILGPTLLPSTFSGEWNRTRLSRAPCVFFDESGQRSIIVDPMRLWEILEDFRIAAPLLRVTWTVRGKEIVGVFRNRRDRDVDVSIVREGRLKSLSISPERHTDIPWTMEFHWVSRGGTQDRVAQVKGDEDLSIITSGLADAIDNMDTFVRTAALAASQVRVPKSATALTLGQLESLAGAPLLAVNRALSKLRYNVGQFKRAALLGKKIATTPFAIYSSVLDFARNTVIVSNQLLDEYENMPAELRTNKRKVADLARASRHFGQIMDGSRDAARKAADLEARVGKSIVAGPNGGEVSVRDSATTRAGRMIAIHVAKAGETPAKVSTKYYQTPDAAADILKANRLPLHLAVFRKGQILVIPTPGMYQRG